MPWCLGALWFRESPLQATHPRPQLQQHWRPFECFDAQQKCTFNDFDGSNVNNELAALARAEPGYAPGPGAQGLGHARR